MPLESFIGGYHSVIHGLAEITVQTLELVGILIIIIGSCRAVTRLARMLITKRPVNITIELGKTLSLALEFKMGAEIVNTVIMREIEELIILGMVIGLSAILTILIHWEIKNEKRECECEDKKLQASSKATE